MKILHLSDLHIRKGWYEEQGVVLSSFIDDIRNANHNEALVVIISGDLVQAGARAENYEEASKFISTLNELGLGKKNLVIAAGNHDVDSDYVNEKAQVLAAFDKIINSEQEATSFFSGAEVEFVSKKFNRHLAIEHDFEALGCGNNALGAGHELTESVGVYCLNTSLFSFGGQGQQYARDDRGKLHIDTRLLHQWLQETEFPSRILVMHHPLDWLSDWARTELGETMRRHFSACFHGHVHAQRLDSHYGIFGNCCGISAPALFSRKGDKLGYAIVDLNDSRVEVQYREWTKAHQRFVSGTTFSGTNDGVAVIFLKQDQNLLANPSDVQARLEIEYTARLHEALRPEGRGKRCWIEPTLSETPEISREAKNAVLLSADEVLASAQDTLIKAPSQYGLTVLGHHLVLRSAKTTSVFPLMYRITEAKNHEAAIKTFFEEQSKRLLGKPSLPDLIIIDEFDPKNKLHARHFGSVKKVVPNARVIMLMRVEDPEKVGVVYSEAVEGEIRELNLWALDRKSMRELVLQYITQGAPFSEELALRRLSDNLTQLNLPRTPHNCDTLLNIFEHQIDASPVNRTEVINLFLGILFNEVQSIPKYNTAPDLKDSLFSLGYFAEQIMKSGEPVFSKSLFIEKITEYAKAQLVEIESDTLFFILCSCGIIHAYEDKYCFRFAYWLQYFAANRMHHSKEFYNFIMSDRRYASHPEIIEFYSGIDRRSGDLLEVLYRDLSDLNSEFESRTNFSDHFDPYEILHWEPNIEKLEEAKEAIENEASHSNIPTELKDAILDKNYDRSKPYQQTINRYISESSLFVCLQIMKCAARALRNSDHAGVPIRKKLLDEIMLTWAREMRIIVVLSPILSEEGHGGLDGLSFYLDESFDKYEGEEKWRRLMTSIPWNVGNFYGQEFFSAKMLPLYLDYLGRTTDAAARHILTIQIVREKPKGWETHVEDYIVSLDKNSFYLSDLAKEMRKSYDIDDIPFSERDRLKNLIGSAYGKHSTGAKRPNSRLRQRVIDAIYKKKKM
ncbi:metallophosphoesterase family protein [Pelagibacterium limicola]|uniref:metallophosphoesterase family protein n=1 Tax=Pelagibacterium limicola TaxID=2791022 RepID=UPI0018AF8B3E|nr:metallophosphoesterase [Pelagibacterium limicola]